MKTTKVTPIEQITKTGYYYVNSDINSKNFPIPETVETEGYKIVRFDKSFSSQEAIDKIKSKGLRPANIYELALLKDNHPELWLKGQWSSMLAFGNTWKDAVGDLRVPYMFAFTDGDFLFDLGCWDGVWGAGRCLVCFCDTQSSGTLALEEDVGSFDPMQLFNALEGHDDIAIKYLKSNGYTVSKEY